jgi:rhodanese-related sulfurtransferase
MSLATISPAGLAQRLGDASGIDLIDVSTPAEFRSVHVQNARNIPLDELDAAAVSSAAGQPIYLICDSGARSEMACEKLQKAGIANVVSVEGGTKACDVAGVPLVRGKGVISLERQVRIGAGSIVLLGVILGWRVHEGFYGLSAFVGAGLVFAGITNTCGMAMLLARMPWNRVAAPAQSCSIKNRKVVKA